MFRWSSLDSRMNSNVRKEANSLKRIAAFQKVAVNVSPGGGVATPGGIRTPTTIRNQTGNPLMDNALMDSWIPLDNMGLHQLWRRIYLRDPICGAAVDLWRELPWSDFTLGGIQDPAILKIYNECLKDHLQVSSWLPEITGEFLSLGKVCLHALFDQSKNIFCLTPDTSVLTKDGWKFISEIQPGEKVLSSNGTDVAMYSEPEALSERPYNGFVYDIKVQGLLSYGATWNHKIPVRRRLGGDSIYLGGGHGDAGYRRVFLSDLEKLTAKEIWGIVNTAATSGKRHFQRERLSIGVPIDRTVVDISDLDYNRLRILGAYIAEGHTSANEHYAIWSLGSHEGEWAKQIKRLIKLEFGKNASIHRYKYWNRKEKRWVRILRVVCCSVDVVRWIKGYVFGHRAPFKSLSPELMRLPLDKQQVLIEWMHKGDGCEISRLRNWKSNIYVTASKHLALQLQQLYLRNNKLSTINKKVVKSGFKPGAIQYHVWLNGDGSGGRLSGARWDQDVVWLPVKKVTRRQYTGKVYNLVNVGDYHCYTIQGGLVGNSDLIVHNPDHIEVSKSPMRNAPIKVDLKPIDDHLNFINCLHGSTLIPTSSGLRRIDEIANIENGRLQKTDLVAGSRYTPARVAKWKYSGKSQTLKIESALGNSVTCTHSHKILVLRGLDLVWVKARDINVGDMLCVNPQSITRVVPLSLELSDPSQSAVKSLKRPTEMTPDLAFILGCLVSEGCVRANRDGIDFVNTSIELLDAFATRVKSVFGVSVSRYLTTKKGTIVDFNGKRTIAKKNCYTIKVLSTTLAKWCSELGIISVPWTKGGKKPSHYKEVPWSILQADKNSQLAFIAAYIEGDGFVNTKDGRIGCSSISRRLIEQMQSMWASHGVIATVSGKKCFGLVASSYDSWKFYQSGLYRHLVNKKPNKRVLAPRKGLGVPVDHIRGLLADRLIPNNPSGTAFIDDNGNKIVVKGFWRVMDYIQPGHQNLASISVDGGGKYITSLLETLKLVSRKSYDKLQSLLQLQYKFVPVTKVSASNVDDDVYDLIMAAGEEPAFIANGIIVHNSTDPRDIAARQSLPKEVLRLLAANQPIPLDPKNTLYIPRRAFAYDVDGLSFFSRAIYFICLERPLFTASILASRRRAGPITQIKAGNEDWEPTPNELDALAQAFIEAEEDAVSAVMATRNDVDINRAVSSLASDMWKISDEYAFISEGKMKALGINDALLSGDATYSTTESALSVTLERIRSHRQFMTSIILTNWICKELARANDFVKRTEAELKHRVRNGSTKSLLVKSAYDEDDSKLIIPTFGWHKQLRPTADEAAVSLLNTAEEKGLPVGLREWAGVTGYPLEEAIRNMPEDLKLRQLVFEHKQKAAKFAPGVGGEDMSGGGGGLESLLGGGGGEEGGEMPQEGGGEGGQPVQGMSASKQAALHQAIHDDGVRKFVHKMPIWDRRGMCIDIHKGEVTEKLHDASFLKVLAEGHPWAQLSQVVAAKYEWSQRKLDVFGYVLFRLGLVRDYKIPIQLVSELSARLQKEGTTTSSSLGLIKEVQFLSMAMRSRQRLDGGALGKVTRLESHISDKKMLNGNITPVSKR